VATHAGRNAGKPAFDPEAVLLEDARQVLRRLELLEPELAKAEDLVDHLLRRDLHRLDVGGDFLLQLFDAGGPGGVGVPLLPGAPPRPPR
jgi:hypothetical protein